MADLFGSARIRSAFARSKKAGRPAFIGFATAGFPTPDTTVPALLALEASGCDVIEVGLPFTDPIGEGPTIQLANEVALQLGVSALKTLALVKEARKQGLKVPVILMGYFNPMLAFGFDNLAKASVESGVDGFIVVDLPPEEAKTVLAAIQAHKLSFVPLITPTTTDDRIARLVNVASSFVYCVSVCGVTGQRANLSDELPAFLARVRAKTELPLAVGFGISTREHVVSVGKIADGAVVGSAIIKALQVKDGDVKASCDAVSKLVTELTGGALSTPLESDDDSGVSDTGVGEFSTPQTNEFSFGEFGGRYIPETLVDAHEELWVAYQAARDDPSYQAELAELRKQYVGGPTSLYFAKRLTEHCKGARVWIKREDLAHTGAHKINNALGQALLAKRLGKKRVIAETGAGQHGVATATACALMGLECIVYMGAEDTRRQSLNVFRMKILGAKVVAVESGSKTLKDAINEAMRDWVTNVRTTHYIIGSAIGPHPFPTIVKDLQSVIGKEARVQMLDQAGKLPDSVVACVGGGSNAIGIFAGFLDDPTVELVGVEAGGENGISGLHSAPLTAGTPGVLHGCRTYLMQDKDGQIMETHSVSAGLDYPGVGPEHSYLKDIGRAKYVCVTDGEALDAFQKMSQLEGIIPALEPAHAVHYALQHATELGEGKDLLIMMSGRGDKDMRSVAAALGVKLED